MKIFLCDELRKKLFVQLKKKKESEDRVRRYRRVVFPILAYKSRGRRVGF